MGKKVDQWRREREAQRNPVDLTQLRPAGMADHQAEQVANMAFSKVNSDLAGSALHQGDAELGETPGVLTPPALGGAVARRRGTNGQQLGGQGLKQALQRFLDLYSERGTMVECARLAGLSWRAIDHHRDTDQAFAEAFRVAEQCVLEKLEREAMRRAVEGTVVRSRKFWHGQLVGEDIRTEYSDNLLMMLLRAKAPTTYRDNSLITINQVIKAVEGFNPAEVLGAPALPQP